MKLILDSEKTLSVVSLAELALSIFLTAFIHLFIFVIYKNVLIILIVTPGCMGNGLENFQNMVIPL